MKDKLIIIDLDNIARILRNVIPEIQRTDVSKTISGLVNSRSNKTTVVFSNQFNVSQRYIYFNTPKGILGSSPLPPQDQARPYVQAKLARFHWIYINKIKDLLGFLNAL